MEIKTGGSVSLLGVLFITLKLTHTIAWSWLWVLSPFWIPWAIVIVVGALVVLVTIIKVFTEPRAFPHQKRRW